MLPLTGVSEVLLHFSPSNNVEIPACAAALALPPDPVRLVKVMVRVPPALRPHSRTRYRQP